MKWPQLPVGEEPTGINTWWDPGEWWGGVPWMLWSCTKHTPCQHQDQFTAELHEEMGKHLIRAGLCGTESNQMLLCPLLILGLVALPTHQEAQGTSASQRHGCSYVWAHKSPSTGPTQSQEHPQASFSWQRANPLLLSSKTWALWSHQCHTAVRTLHDEALSVQA